jgi:hypothetical protein
MLDPLRSLAELVRTLTRPRTEARGDSRTAAKPSSPDHAPPLDEAQALREKLRQRIRLVGTADRRRTREVFVETVLAAELGERVTLDPAMTEIISKVAQQLGDDASTDRNLRLLFDDLAK